MITQTTAADIWHCHREIAASEKLLKDIAEVRMNSQDRFERGFEPKLKDAFGQERQLKLGVPSGENSHQIFGVAPELAESIIRAHIANMRAKLVSFNEKARIELGNEA
jgi:hypothetical protein